MPPSPPRPPPAELRTTITTTASITELPQEDDIPIATDPDPKSKSIESQTSTKSSFADLKKGRQVGKKAFAAPVLGPQAAMPSPSPPTQADSPQVASPSNLTLSAIALNETAPITSTSSNASVKVEESPTAPIPLLDPLAPGSAMALITSIRRHTASATYPLLSHLSTNPPAIGKMLDNFLEPDQLTLILTRLNETLDLEGEDRAKEVVRRFMVGMTQTRRWGMTAIMLSKAERALGQGVWSTAGGEGDFARRQEV